MSTYATWDMDWMAGRALSASSSHAQPLQLRVIDMAKHLIPITKAAVSTGIRVINNNHQDENDWDILWSFRTACATIAFSKTVQNIFDSGRARS